MATILIEVQLYSELRRKIPDWNKTERIAIRAGTTVRELLRSIGVHTVDQYILVLDGKGIDADTMLKQGDRIAVYPAMDGG